MQRGRAFRSDRRRLARVVSVCDLDRHFCAASGRRTALRAGAETSRAFRDPLDIDDFAPLQRAFALTQAPIRRGWGARDIETIPGGDARRHRGETWGETRV